MEAKDIFGFGFCVFLFSEDSCAGRHVWKIRNQSMAAWARGFNK